jgi:hypothetical protein
MVDRNGTTETFEHEYLHRYKWRQTWPGESDHDFVGDDDGAYIGRIYRVDRYLIKGKWKWNGASPKANRGTPATPNSGLVDTVKEAARKVEEYWDAAKERRRRT